MTEETSVRLLEAIAANRLLVLCGAGLSMSPPSSLPSAVTVAQRCAVKYQTLTGTPLAAALQGDIEAMSQHFRDCDRFPFFIGDLVPWADFTRDPNPGHETIADLLACGVCLAGVTTNFDFLIEVAAGQLGEPDFRAIVDVEDIPQNTRHKPYLKLHGCEVRSRRTETIWCREQLDDEPISERMTHFRNWLAAHLLGRDLLLVGFWSDWAYLTELFAMNLAAVTPQHVYLVNPGTAAELEAKAPALWAWAHGPGITCHHERQPGAEFLDELRRRWSRLFVTQLAESSRPTYQTLFGVAPSGNPVVPEHLDSSALYALRRDLTGTPRTTPVRDKEPHVSDHVAGAIHTRLLEAGATYSGHAYGLNERTFRLVSARGQVLSAVKAQFQGEPPLPIAIDAVVCAGALPDPSPSHIVRAAESTTLVRSGALDSWETQEALLRELGAADG